MACNKIAFASRAEAKERGRGIAANERGRKVYPYLCSRCERWHLTSQDRPAQRRGMRKRGLR